MAPANLYGYAGKFLRVDLTKETITEEKFDETTLKKYLGGTGIGAKILYEEVPPGVDWSDPQNRLILATGPLGGTSIGGSGSFSVVTKGPLTNGATSTQANGFFGAFLKFSGYDGIILHGASPRWVYLHIHEGTAELKDANHLMGKDTWETEDAIKEELGQSERGMSIFGIGPAGENLVKFAAIVGDKGHVAAHNGVGAVMGSKKLKAVAVARGSGGFAVKDKDGLAQISRGMLDHIKNDPALSQTYKWGTLGGIHVLKSMSALPVKNYTTNVWDIDEERLSKFSPKYIRGNFKPKPKPCWACQMHHCSIMEITEGPYTGDLVEEPEYECFAAWGPVIGQKDVASAMRLASDVDRLGFDTNEAGWVVGLAMECFQKGLITKGDTGGLELTWGNVEATRILLRNIACRQGIGNILAEGVMRAAALIGGEAVNFAVHTKKGNTPRGHDHRVLWGELFDTCVSNTGTIESGLNASRKQFGLNRALDAFSPDDLVDFEARSKGASQFEDSLGVCRFNTLTDVQNLCRAVNAATGWDFDFDQAMTVGKRAVNLLRAFNIRHGIAAGMDAPSPRYGSTPEEGLAKGKSIIPVLEDMVRNYYQQLGWDTETGRPLPETLRNLGLEHVITDIW